MKVTVRRAEAEDATQIAVCLATLGYDTSTTLVAEELSALMGSSSDTVLVADYPTNGIVGVVSVHLLPLFHAAGNLARLTSLAVVPEHQRKGVGRALVAAAEAFAWEHVAGEWRSRVEIIAKMPTSFTTPWGMTWTRGALSSTDPRRSNLRLKVRVRVDLRVRVD